MKLKEIRKRKKLTQSEVAKHLEITQQAYANYENGKREPNFNSLTKLANFFDVSIDYLLDETDDPTAPNKTALSNFESTKKLLEELSKIDIDINKESELETVLNFIDTNKEILKKLINKE